MDTQTQINLELLYSKNQTMPRLRAWFDVPALEEHCKTHEIPKDFALDLLAQMVEHGKASISILVGILYKHFGDTLQDMQACADMIWKAAEVDLVDFDPTADLFFMRHSISAELQEEIDRYQYPLPMVVPPQELTHNRQTGYFTIKGSVILNDGHHEDDACLDHLNKMNQIPLTVNAETVRLVQNQWKNLDSCKPDETVEEFQKRRRAFHKYDQDSREVIEGLLTLGGPFWLTWKYDSRGRCYAQGYHVNPQGNQWSKASVEFYEEEIVV